MKLARKTIKLLIATPMMPPEIGGPATYSKFLLEKLPSRGFEVRVQSYSSTTGYPKLIRYAMYFFRILKDSFWADIVYAMDPVFGLAGLCAAKITGKKFCLKVVGDYAWEQGTQRFGVSDMLDYFVQADPAQYSRPVRWLKRVQTFVATHAFVIVTPSKYLKNIIKQWGVNPNKISVIYNAFSLDYEPVSKQELRLLLELKGTVLFSAGRLVPWKGFEALIQVFKELIFQRSDLKLFIAGDGPDHSHLVEVIKRERLDGKVILLGKLPHAELLKYIKASDLFILNTGYEGFSHQLLEVMALGTPLITTKVGGNPELVEQGRSGLLIDYNDRIGLKDALNLLLEHPLEAEKMAHNAREKVGHFTEERLLDNTVRLFERLI